MSPHNPLVLCPHCDEEVRNNVLRRHVAVCERRPSDGLLLAMREADWPWIEISEFFGVSQRQLHRWFNSADQNAPREEPPERDTSEAPPLELHGDVAPLYKRRASSKRLFTACFSCPGLQVCLVIQPWWVLCEAPDISDFYLWNELGFDWREAVEQIAKVKVI